MMAQGSATWTRLGDVQIWFVDTRLERARLVQDALGNAPQFTVTPIPLGGLVELMARTRRGVPDIVMFYAGIGDDEAQPLDMVLPVVDAYRRRFPEWQRVKIVALNPSRRGPWGRQHADKERFGVKTEAIERAAYLGGCDLVVPDEMIAPPVRLGQVLAEMPPRTGQLPPIDGAPAHARPTFVHGLLLTCVEAWLDELTRARLLQDAQYSDLGRVVPIAFLAADKIRRDAGLREPVVPLFAQFFDWQALAGISFFSCPALEQALRWLCDGDHIRTSVSPQLTPLGKRMLFDLRFGSDRVDTVYRTPRLTDALVTDAVRQVVADAAGLPPVVFRDYLLNCSFELFNDGVSHGSITFDRRFGVASRGWVEREGLEAYYVA